jgi:dTDP-4-amino-4,6-dideoxygalactose transaminase
LLETRPESSTMSRNCRMTEVPFSDLRAQYRSIKADVDEAIQGVVDSQYFIRGPVLEQFESEFAAASGSKHCIGVSNGTSAISLALEANGIGHGDEVIVPSMTFAATAEAVCHVGATPVFVDSNDDTLTMSVESLQSHINQRTRAVVPVHLYGNPCDMDPIIEVADGNGLVVIEDAAQAHLATYGGRPVGSFGAAATYSFYPGKNLGAYGDAGAVTTPHVDIADRIRLLRDHGRTGKHTHEMVGYNSRLDSLQAAVLSAKLRYLASWTDTRRSIALQYDNVFGEAGIRTMAVPPTAEASYHLYPIRVVDRDRTIEAIRAKGISCGIHYPIPLHKQPAFNDFAVRDDHLPASEDIGNSEISLPIFPEMTQDQIDRVITVVTEVARSE